MRKIEEAMIDAINNCASWKQANTEVTVGRSAYSQRTTRIYLHGNQICQINDFPHRREISIYDCGWKTATTKSRLNAILDHFNLARIYQLNGIWYRGEHGFIGAELINS